MKTQTKHNKKRNVGIIYELLLKHLGNCLIDGNLTELKKVTKILEKRFANGTELYKEFRLFNALAQTTASDTHIVASILSEAKYAARECDIKKLNKEKSDLIRDINYKINDSAFYYRSISNYRDLATIQIMLNEWRKKRGSNVQKLIEFEQKIGTLLLQDKKTINLENEMKRLNASDSSSLILKIMTEKINKKYGSDLSESQKEIIRNYAIYSEGDKKAFKQYLTIKKKEAQNLLENFEVIENNKILIQKVSTVRERIEELKIDNIDDDSIIKFLTVTKLITELNQSGD
jgi:hypothetical protein